MDVALDGASREAFRPALAVDADTWARGRGWALWKALITLAGGGSWAAGAGETLGRVLAESAASRG